MIEKWRKSLDEGGVFEALITGLSKAFNCLRHELLIAKLHDCGGRYHLFKTIALILS